MHELLRKEDMHIRFRRRRTRTTYSDYGYVRYKNLIEGLEVTAVNQLYVSDITGRRARIFPWESILPTLTWSLMLAHAKLLAGIYTKACMLRVLLRPYKWLSSKKGMPPYPNRLYTTRIEAFSTAGAAPLL